MPLFVDFAGLNTLVSSSFNGNTLSSGINPSISSINDSASLAGINIHRNGLYGYSSWRQLRVSENPITRYHRANNTMTFIIQPGPTRNVLANGEFRVKDRYSKIYSFTEPAIAQKAYPLVWNVGRHFKDENGNLDLNNPTKFSIISSYANQGIGFANSEVDEFHNFDPDEEKSEYREIYKLYADGGLNSQKSPITYWEFLQYRETVFPHMKNQFQKENLTRTNFFNFFKHDRQERRVMLRTSSFGFIPHKENNQPKPLSQSTWPLDPAEDFLTRTSASQDFNITFNSTGVQRSGEGILQSTVPFFSTEVAGKTITLRGSNNSSSGSTANTVIGAHDDLAGEIGVSPIFSRRHVLKLNKSVTNPAGIPIPETASNGGDTIKYTGDALWEAGAQREIKDENGNYIPAPRFPFFKSYEDFADDMRRLGKNFTTIPEYRMSPDVDKLLNNKEKIDADLFKITGSSDSTSPTFYKTYSNTDFMRQFELINKDHEEFTNGKVLSLRCKAIKKFLPYEGFYPCQRTVDLAKSFFDGIKDNVSMANIQNMTIKSSKFPVQNVMVPLFAPGILFNSIKSGVAVDYPIFTGSINSTIFPVESGNRLLFQDKFDERVPFEALLEPKRYLADRQLTTQEPDDAGKLEVSSEWDGELKSSYRKMANNFLAETINFFLPNGNLTSMVSKPQGDGIFLEDNKTYAMRVFMRRSMAEKRSLVFLEGSGDQKFSVPQDIYDGNSETFTMFSRPSAFGPPSLGLTHFTSSALHRIEGEEDANIGPSVQNSSVAGVQYGHRYEAGSMAGQNFPFTPPYYHGDGWCDIKIRGQGRSYTIEELQATASYEYSRFDFKYMEGKSSGVFRPSLSQGPQAIRHINLNAVQLSGSLNLKGIGTVRNTTAKSSVGNFVVDTSLDQDARWIIQTKFETPMLNFNHISAVNENITLPTLAPETVPRGLWHQYGRIPELSEGVFMGVTDIPISYQRYRLGLAKENLYGNLADKLGFSSDDVKIGRIASSKTIHEAVVAVPFVVDNSRKKFFAVDKQKVNIYKTATRDGNSTLFNSLIAGDPQSQIGRTLLKQMQKMEKYIFPPSFDFIHNDDVDPIAMYIFEFSHTLSQQDLSDIWQNLPPDIGTEMEVQEVAITHPLLKKELLGQGGENGNTLIDMPNKLRWMVFKVKERASSNYFKKTVLRNTELNQDKSTSNATIDEFGETSTIQYNWPYDFFSLVELVKIDAEVEFGNFTKEAIENYTESIPEWDVVVAEPEQIEAATAEIADEIVDDPIIDQVATIQPVGYTAVAKKSVAAVLSGAAPSETSSESSSETQRPYEQAKAIVLQRFRSLIREDLEDRNKKWRDLSDRKKSQYAARAKQLTFSVTEEFGGLGVIDAYASMINSILNQTGGRQEIARLVERFPNLANFIDRLDKDDYR